MIDCLQYKSEEKYRKHKNKGKTEIYENKLVAHLQLIRWILTDSM